MLNRPRGGRGAKLWPRGLAVAFGMLLSAGNAGADSFPFGQQKPFIPDQIVSSTIPLNGDVNPYGVAIVPILPSVVDTLPTSTKPRRRTPRAVVRPGCEPGKNVVAVPEGATIPLGVS